MKAKKSHKKINNVKYFLTVLGLLLIVIGFAILGKSYLFPSTKITANNNLSKVLDEEELKKAYGNLLDENVKAVFYEDFTLAVKNSKKWATSFIGKLTHYGPDCKGCGGHVACTGQDVRNGNIYYDDSEYGKVRIVAADRSLPCGSIIRVNIKEYNYMYAIVLDRGGIIKGARIDLLKESSKAYSPVRTVNKASFDILRYGY